MRAPVGRGVAPEVFILGILNGEGHGWRDKDGESVRCFDDVWRIRRVFILFPAQDVCFLYAELYFFIFGKTHCIHIDPRSIPAGSLA